ncbi:uncharacterized protein LOC17885545 [Capsella rubella]|uniref:uncharacterized protein LOC17885545 n=1 Tax=Capsella rubella TaxID=81985 RepID=UPI000CD51AEE|nr:uncharacterized protein LOC17885545 [Capsella rubella]
MTERNVRSSAPTEALLRGRYWSKRGLEVYEGGRKQKTQFLTIVKCPTLWLLKKHGWKEGTGLGIAEQGILVPLQAEPRHNKQGLGSEKTAKRKAAKPRDTDSEALSKKSKKLSKKLRKTIEHEKLLAEKEFERAFRREFWHDNV